MSTGAVAAGGSSGVDWRRAEFVLAGLALLSFVLIPLRLKTIYSGLPAHPLFLHVPVMLIPISAVGALAVVARPAWFERFGVALGTVTVVALASLFLTIGAGQALRSALHLTGTFGPAQLISRHAHDAGQLRIVYILFTAVMILALAAHRIAAGAPTGFALADRSLAGTTIRTVLRVLLVVLALGSAYLIFKTGDAGAKAVWQGRLSGHGGGGFAPPGGGTGGALGPGGG